MNIKSFTVSINLDKFEYDKDKEEQLIEDIQSFLEVSLVIDTNLAIKYLDRNRGEIQSGWIIEHEGKVFIAEVDEYEVMLQCLSEPHLRKGPFSKTAGLIVMSKGTSTDNDNIS
jgi:hypothetical protein